MRLSIARTARSLSRNQTAVILLTSQLSIAGGAFAVNILSAWALGPAMRGELALFLQIAYAGNLLCLLGRQTAYLRFPQAVPSLPDSYNEARLLSRIPMGIAAGSAVVIGMVFGQWSVSALILSIALFVKLSSGILINMQRAASIIARSAKPFLVASIASQLLLLIGAIVLVLVPVSTPAPWLMLYGLSSALPYLLTQWVVSRRDSRSYTKTQDLRPIAKLGLHLFPATVAEAVLSRADKFLLPALSTFEELGVYAVVVTMTDLIAWPIKQYSESKIPDWRKAYEANQLRWGSAFRKVLGAGALLAGLAGITIYFIIEPVFGSEYSEGRSLVLPLVLAAVLQNVITFAKCMNVALGRPGLVTVIASSAMIGSVPALLLLIPHFGAIGAAWSMVIGSCVGATVAIVSLFRIARKARVAHAGAAANENRSA